MKTQRITRYELDPDQTRKFFGGLLETPEAKIKSCSLQWLGMPDLDHPGMIVEIIEAESEEG